MLRWLRRPEHDEPVLDRLLLRHRARLGARRTCLCHGVPVMPCTVVACAHREKSASGSLAKATYCLVQDARTSNTKPLGGIGIADLEKSWAGAFLPKAEGGCQ